MVRVIWFNIIVNSFINVDCFAGTNVVFTYAQYRTFISDSILHKTNAASTKLQILYIYFFLILLILNIVGIRNTLLILYIRTIILKYLWKFNIYWFLIENKIVWTKLCYLSKYNWLSFYYGCTVQTLISPIDILLE